MAKKMISALKEVVGESVTLEEKRGKVESALMNKNRLAIFQFLCRVPGSSLINLSKHLRLSLSTIKWHLKKLKNEKYVIEINSGNRLTYFPKGMLESQFMEVLCVLNEDLPRAVFFALIKTPGITQNKLAKSLDAGIQPLRYALRKLGRSDLILSVIDGRFRRYYPTDEIYALDSRNRRKLRQFKAKIMKRLEAELLNPKIFLTKTRVSMIEIDTGTTKMHLHIPSDIFASILSHYAAKIGEENRHEGKENRKDIGTLQGKSK